MPHTFLSSSVLSHDCLLQHFGRYGAPQMIRSGRGSHFATDLIKQLLVSTGTPHNLTLAYSKQENAIVERVNKEINRYLRSFLYDTNDVYQYKNYLPFIQRIWNSSIHSSTNASPASKSSLILEYCHYFHSYRKSKLPPPK